MAYAAIVSLSQILAEQVTDVDQQQIKSLHEKLCFLQSFMEDFAYNISEKANSLEERIREAAYQAEDIIELHVLNAERSLVFKCGQMQNLEIRCKKDLLRVIEKINSIVEEATKIKSDNNVETPIPRRSLPADSSPISRISTAVGFNDDLLEIKTRLCGESQKLQIISIVGMGGIGKTTLARNVFDDSLIAEHFDFHVWITISQEYCVQHILLSFLSSLNALTDDLSQKRDEVLAEHVYKKLKGRRYLIIMDDMWSTIVWDEVRRVLPDDNNGSRVIITTRLSEVAIYADHCSPLHQLQLLNVDQSWSLLQKKVFENELCPKELEKIGKMIAAKCGGLPLAVVLVAGLLSKVDATLNYWEKFAANVSLAMETNDDHLFKILSLSYNNLGHHLRACFLYMGGFPEDSEIPILKLTMLWTAEGFLKPITSKSSEEVAEEYVMDLVKRNLISFTLKSSSGKYRFCRIHDLLRDFCKWKANEENFLLVNKIGNTSEKGTQNTRRLCNFVNSSIPTKTSCSFVRSILFSNKDHQYLTSVAISYRLLRVLDGPNVQLTCIPAAVTELFHLRYLALSHDYSIQFVVPARILKLRNLQTLIIGPLIPYSRTFRFPADPKIHLPLEIWQMPKLRHLIMNNCCFSPVPVSPNKDPKVYVLQNLQKLSKVADFCFAKETIEMIPNLKKLGVVYHIKSVRPVIKWSEYQLNNLLHLHQLESLSITCNVLSSSSTKLQSAFTRNFALPLKIKKLTLTGSRLSRKNLSVIGQLPNLEVLKLRRTAFEEAEWRSKEGEFLKLKFLLIEHLNVQCWQVEEYTHFPSLEQLIIKYCWGIQEIPSGIGEIPTLRYIEVVSVLKPIRVSAIQIREEQRSFGNDSLQVHVPNAVPRWGMN